MSMEEQGATTVGLDDPNGVTAYNLKILNSAVAPPPPPSGIMETGTGLQTQAFANGPVEPVVVYQSIMAEPLMSETQRHLGPRLIMGVFALCLLALSVVAFTGESDPATNLMAFFKGIGQSLGFDSTPDVVVESAPKTHKKKKAVTSSAPTEPSDEELLAQFNPAMLENPYWYLPNPSLPPASPFKSNPGDANRLSDGLNHQYTYQNYKAVREARAKQLQHVEDLYARALTHRKYWTRMEALMALAELRGALSPDEVEKAIGDARSSLITYHRQRLTTHPTPHAMYVLRSMLRLVDAPNRVGSLQFLLDQGEYEHRLYLAAATFDPSPEVKTWLADYLPHHPLPDGVLREFKIETARAWRHAATEAQGTAATAHEAVVQGIEQNSDGTAAPDPQGIEVEDVPVQKIELYKDAAGNRGQGSDKVKQEQRKADMEKAKDDGFESLGGKEFAIPKTPASSPGFPPAKTTSAPR